MRLTLSLTVTAALFLASCQTATDGLVTSSAVPSLSSSAASAIAGDMAGRYAEQAGSTSRPIRLHKDKSDFANALEAALRGWGYMVVGPETSAEHKGSSQPVALAYSLVNLDGQILARLSTDALELGRVYTLSTTGATPSSPLSLMKRN